MCPDLELYDLRVLPDDPNDTADEFTIIAALQFVRHLNAHKDLMVVHGANLSLSVPHDVANFGCGRTPVWNANGWWRRGRRCDGGGQPRIQQDDRSRGGGPQSDGTAGDYRYISITDPGNAEGVITVGSTH